MREKYEMRCKEQASLLPVISLICLTWHFTEVRVQFAARLELHIFAFYFRSLLQILSLREDIKVAMLLVDAHPFAKIREHVAV